MKIRRTNLLDAVHEAIAGPAPDLTPDEELLAERDERFRQWRGHLHAYVSVNAGLLVMNGVMAILSGVFVPWSVLSLFGWGIGLGIHTLNHQAWLRDERPNLIAAERRLGLESPSRRMLAGPKVTDPWPALVGQCSEAVRRTKTIISEVHPAATTALTDLDEGLDTVVRLAAGSDRIQQVLDGMDAEAAAPALEQRIVELDARISRTDDAALRETQLANRALLLERRAKLKALRTDQDRMLAKAQGFLLAVENLYLDAARLNGPEVSDVLSEPIHRLTEEVQILRQVDAELKALPT